MNSPHLLRRCCCRRGPRADERPPPLPLPVWVGKCTIYAVPNHEARVQVIDTAPGLRRHYIGDHRMPPADVSLNQPQLMIRRRLSERQEQEQPRYSALQSLREARVLIPRWPTGPADDAYGLWMVRGVGLREARERREESNPREWERMFAPDCYYDKISGRVRMARGRMWDEMVWVTV